MGKIYDLNLVEKINFDNKEIIEFTNVTDKCAGRLSDADIANMPSDSNDIGALRIKLAEYFYLKLENSYAKLEQKCDIKRDTFQKFLRFSKGGRNITYPNLAKFCIGAELSIEQTKELFRYMGHELSEKIKYDYILICEINNKGDVLEYDQSLKRFGFPGVLSDADMLSADK